MPIDSHDFRVATQNYNCAVNSNKNLMAKVSSRYKIKDNQDQLSVFFNSLMDANNSTLPRTTRKKANNINLSRNLICGLLFLSCVNNIASAERGRFSSTNHNRGSKAIDGGGGDMAQNVTSHIQPHNPLLNQATADAYHQAYSMVLNDAAHIRPGSGRHKRIRRSVDNLAQRNNVIDYQKYANAHCRARMKTLDGKKIGAGTLIASAALPSGRTTKYQAISDGSMSTVLAEKIFLSKVNDGVDSLVGYRTDEVSPLTRHALIKVFKEMSRLVEGDSSCEKDKPSLIEMVKFNLGYDARKRLIIRNQSVETTPAELLDTIAFQPRGLFVQQRQPSGIYTEKRAYITHQGKEYFLQEHENGDIWGYDLDVADNHVRVYFDAKTQKINLSEDMPDTEGVDVHIVNGNSFIPLEGVNYELIYDWKNNIYSVVLKKQGGAETHIPVYMDPLSSTWFMEMQNQHAVYNDQESDIISSLAVPMYDNRNYGKQLSANRDGDGNALLYGVSREDDPSRTNEYSVIEMKGKLLPVRLNNGRYEVYNNDAPQDDGYPVEYDGNRWLFYKPSSVHASSDLQAMFPDDLYARNVDARSLYSPDHRGLRWDRNKTAHLKVNDRYIQMKSMGGDRFRVKGMKTFSALRFYNNAFYLESFTDRLENLLSKGHSGIDHNRAAPNASPAYDNSGVMVTLAFLANTEPDAAMSLLRKYDLADTPRELDNADTVKGIIDRLNMHQVAAGITYPQLKDMAAYLKNGGYFVMERAEADVDEDVPFFGYAMKVKNEQLTILGKPLEYWLDKEDSLTVWGPYPK